MTMRQFMETVVQVKRLLAVVGAHTNGTDDGGTAEVLRGHHLGVELGVPLQLHPVGQVVEGGSGRHCECARQS